MHPGQGMAEEPDIDACSELKQKDEKAHIIECNENELSGVVESGTPYCRNKNKAICKLDPAICIKSSRLLATCYYHYSTRNFMIRTIRIQNNKMASSLLC
ncbi:Hypothetical predicted protein, partial [Paramuricea clavata]